MRPLLSDQPSRRNARQGRLVLLSVALAAAGGCAPPVDEAGQGQTVEAAGEGDKAQKRAATRAFPVAGNFALLESFYHPGHEDHATMSNNAAKDSLINSGYRPTVNEEGYVSQSPLQGMVPLKVYAGPGDYFSTATAQGEADARGAGYVFQRIDGYVYPSPQPLTRPLDLYWHAGRGDNFTTATNGQAALAAGYVRVRTEGYVFSTAPTVPLKLYWHAGREDALHTANGSPLEEAARAAGYVQVAIDGQVLRHQYPGTVALKNFWSSARGDHYATATAAGEQTALGAGYGFVRTEGYVYPSFHPNTHQMTSFWHAGRGDHTSTVTRNGEARQTGYAEVRVEGWAFSD